VNGQDPQRAVNPSIHKESTEGPKAHRCFPEGKEAWYVLPPKQQQLAPQRPPRMIVCPHAGGHVSAWPAKKAPALTEEYRFGGRLSLLYLRRKSRKYREIDGIFLSILA
jgi:hypothetical protein